MTPLYAFLDIAIVLSAVYTALSCLVSWINERIAEILSLRGETLFSGVLNLVMGEASLAIGIFEHPLITAARNDKNGKPDLSKPYRPSYLDARNFSMALWQTVRLPQPAGGAAAVTGNLLQASATPVRSMEAQDAVSPAAIAALETPGTLLADVAARVASLADSPLKTALSALLQQAGNDYQQLLAVTDGWFNAQMDRVSGWYKRRAQYFIAAIAFAVVILTGLDSVEIVTRLYADPGTRESLAAGIAAGVSQPSPAGAAPGAAASANASQERAVTKIVAGDAQTDLASFFHQPWGGGELQHVPGMLVTLAALTLGGPFWFDLLCSVINVRAAGRKPQRSDQPPQ